MRTSRILEMVYLLLKDRQQKAQDLADHFGVSTKTIYRDVETLNKAGVPISMQQGIGGGIKLNENYLINKFKLTPTEEKALMKAIDDIKKLPNAQLKYALQQLKQFYNEAGTLWVNTDDVSLNIQDKFHQVKNAVIEKHVIEFQYYKGSEFTKYRVEPYELRVKSGAWKVIVRNIKEDTFEEVYLSRMKEIDIKTKHFTRLDIPDVFSKRYIGAIKTIKFEVIEMTDQVLNTFPIESFEFVGDNTYLYLKVKLDEDVQQIVKKYPELKTKEVE